MATTDLIADLLTRNLEMFKMHLADFSDADMLVRPTLGANHAAWQVGHLAKAERHLMNTYAPDTVPPPPPGFEERFTKDTAKIDDAAAFPPKAELLAALDTTRGAIIKWVKTLSPEDLERPGPEKFRQFAPTLGGLGMMHAMHATMHIGQFQVIRRKLGKPLIF